MPVTIDLPDEGVTVTVTCPNCFRPCGTTSGSVSWTCGNPRCWTEQIPMWEDARFVDGDGTEWIFTDDEDWIDVVNDTPRVTLSLPEDPWLIQYLVDDDEVAFDLFAPIGEHAVMFDAARMPEVIACLAEHAENCLMQQSRRSAIFIGEVIGDLGTRKV